MKKPNRPPTSAEIKSAQRAVQKAETRVLLYAKRWAKQARGAEVLSSTSHHLLRAIDNLEKMEQK